MDESSKLKCNQKQDSKIISRYYWTGPVSWNVIRKTRQQNSRICDSYFIKCNSIFCTLFGTPFLDPFWAKWLFTYLFYPLYGPKLCCHVAVANLCKCISMLYWTKYISQTLSYTWRCWFTRDIPMKHCSNSVFIRILRETNLTIWLKLANN